MSSPVFIVTGASRGMGLAITEYLLRDSSSPRLFLVARTASALEALQSKYGADRIRFLASDIGTTGIPTQVVNQCVKEFGKLDAICANHGTLGSVSKLADADIEGWRKTFDINTFSVVELVKAAIPELRKSKGRVIVVSSGAATTPYLAWGAYGGSKATVNHLCSTLGAEEKDITAVAIRPGVVDTEMQREIREVHPEAMGEGFERFRNLKRDGILLKPEQPGNVIARLTLSADKELSGKFLSWNDTKVLAKYQDA